uniref:Uncharacterized protein n=1 Tax=Peronospora matthiolae TaxID=2874970 RepID=A0AAV1TL24_9STRA
MVWGDEVAKKGGTLYLSSSGSNGLCHVPHLYAHETFERWKELFNDACKVAAQMHDHILLRRQLPGTPSSTSEKWRLSTSKNV